LFVLSLCVWAPATYGDTVHLRNGGRLDGIVTELTATVRIEMECGMVEIPRNQVASVEMLPTALGEYRRRAAALAGGSAEDHSELGRWAAAVDLSQMAEREFRRVIALDPEHDGARLALGYERMDGRWVTHEEAMQLRGFVRLDGRWVTKEEFGLRTALATEESLRREERRIAEDERTRQMELERRMAAEEAQLARLREQNAQYARVNYGRNYGYRRRSLGRTIRYGTNLGFGGVSQTTTCVSRGTAQGIVGFSVSGRRCGLGRP